MKLIKFEKNDCSPCGMVDQLFKEAEVEFDEVYNLDTDDNMDKFNEYEIQSVPVVILETDDNYHHVLGFDYDALQDVVKEYKSNK